MPREAINLDIKIITHGNQIKTYISDKSPTY